jgi:hypothetical protein
MANREFTPMRSLPIALVALLPAVAAVAADAPPTFEEHVLPVFREKCCGCHNADKKQGGLDLTSFSQALAGGSSGEVIAPGDAEGSYLWQLASHSSEPKMPPQADRIPSDMLETIRRWIDGGAIERVGGKPRAMKKSVSLALAEGSAKLPDGPPVMPPPLPLEVESEGSRGLAVTALAASPNGSLAAVGGRRQVLLYDTVSLDLLGVLAFPEGDVKTLRFSRNARVLVAGGGRAAASGRVVLWDVEKGERITDLGDEYDEVLAADLTADQAVVALGGPQKVVRLLATDDGSVRAEIRKHTDWITALEFSPDGRLLATGDRAGNVFLWETRGAREDATLKGHAGGITALAWRGDGQVLATASEDGRIRLWNPQDGEKIKEWQAHADGVQGVAWLADGRIASCGRDKKVVLWKGDGGKERDFGPLATIGLRVVATSDSSRLVAGDLAGGLTVFTIADGKAAGHPDTNPARLEKRIALAREAVEKRTSELATAEAALVKATGADQTAAADGDAAGEATKALAESRKRAEAARTALSGAAESLERLEKAAGRGTPAVDP